MHSGKSQNQDRKSRLSMQATAMLHKMSPELLKLNLELSLARVAEEYSQAGEELVKQADLGENLSSLEEVQERVRSSDPVKLANEMFLVNRQMDPSRLLKVPPLEPLKAVLQMLLNNDH